MVSHFRLRFSRYFRCLWNVRIIYIKNQIELIGLHSKLWLIGLHSKLCDPDIYSQLPHLRPPLGLPPFHSRSRSSKLLKCPLIPENISQTKPKWDTSFFVENESEQLDLGLWSWKFEFSNMRGFVYRMSNEGKVGSNPVNCMNIGYLEIRSSI